ncbi:GatB/YqeY domain-containing protein [Acinetobacter sichuanensis]|uniref:GatB/YqeY domain-containing protein n=1 Tax=Acinetobacter sichuanensis TaxID=2136183 RepID=A0A371YSJ2_9GAMM|nr:MULTISPECIES: GatB/YqeY domain-containing protein [Acinetobacter]MDM1247427.1 GatB/YqeY domain-containing protein [Acinetobacter sp. R933-2]MDM1763193.1 GatB/YqeY domain-containing protein [Acinetobacter sp. 226-1]MDM1766672.1 GatB/YqeY domain-containing protein [Acinetobacter sp. 226-4]MDQ9020213.1 GatB/YqeY domain-containing protein [Acinetobacter sichuanensis]RFC84439.1 GatB/YqeY domain-containing protein [Acinetobacter sichuanensis]
MTTLKNQITDVLKAAMRAKEMDKLTVIRGLQAAIKQIEVDERIELDDTQVLAVIEKQIKQRKESIKAFLGANREDLASKEQAEIEVLSQFLPEAMSEDELDSLIAQTIEAQGATSMKDMGKVMNSLRPIIAGRADPAQVSAKIKAKLA